MFQRENLHFLEQKFYILLFQAIHDLHIRPPSLIHDLVADKIMQKVEKKTRRIKSLKFNSTSGASMVNPTQAKYIGHRDFHLEPDA